MRGGTVRVDMRVVARGDPEFPEKMDEVSPPVERLWVTGRDLRELAPRVAIVGARSPTPYGLEVGHALAADLATTGLCVVSGMARGIDAAAHDGALGGGGSTIAVLGSGVDLPYPACNRSLFERIVESGAVVSEFPPGTPARAHHFPHRNRVIVGLSLGVVLVQAAGPTSGGMITAGLAVRFNREVFAVPGDVRSDLSNGPHELLRDGAHLCAAAGDVLTALKLEMSWADPATAGPPPPGLREDETAVMIALAAGPAPIDEIAERTAMDVIVTGRALTRLELRGLVGRGRAASFRRLR